MSEVAQPMQVGDFVWHIVLDECLKPRKQERVQIIAWDETGQVHIECAGMTKRVLPHALSWQPRGDVR